MIENSKNYNGSQNSSKNLNFLFFFVRECSCFIVRAAVWKSGHHFCGRFHLISQIFIHQSSNGESQVDIRPRCIQSHSQEHRLNSEKWVEIANFRVESLSLIIAMQWTLDSDWNHLSYMIALLTHFTVFYSSLVWRESLSGLVIIVDTSEAHQDFDQRWRTHNLTRFARCQSQLSRGKVYTLLMQLDNDFWLSLIISWIQREVSSEFEAILKDFESNPNVKSAVVISAKPGCELHLYFHT